MGKTFSKSCNELCSALIHSETDGGEDFCCEDELNLEEFKFKKLISNLDVNIPILHFSL